MCIYFIIKIKFSMASILDSHYNNYKTLIEDVKSKCANRKIIMIEPISFTVCLESYPCQGHKGVKIHFDTGNMINYPCSSVDIGLIMCYFNVKTVHDAHFTSYVTDDMCEKLKEMKKK